MKNEEGYALILSMIILTVLLVIVIGLTSIITNEIHISSYEINSTRALYAAEAGLEYARTIIDEDIFWDDSGNLIEEKIISLSISIDGGKINNINISKDGKKIILISTGRSGDVTKKLHVTYEKQISPSFYQLIVSGGKMEFGKESIIKNGTLYSNSEIDIKDSILENVNIKEKEAESIIPYIDFEEIKKKADNFDETEIGDNITYIDGNLIIEKERTINGNGILLVDGDLTVKKEAAVNVNYDSNDYFIIIAKGDINIHKEISYQGLIFAEGSIKLSKEPRIKGTVIAKETVEFGKEAEIEFDNSYVNTFIDKGINVPGGGENGVSNLILVSWQEE